MKGSVFLQKDTPLQRQCRQPDLADLFLTELCCSERELLKDAITLECEFVCDDAW